MKPSVRVTESANIIGPKTKVEIRNGEEWIDISQFVTRVDWGGSVGDASRVSLVLLPGGVSIQGRPSPDSLEQFASFLRAHGWDVSNPKDVVDVTSFGSEIRSYVMKASA